jgi:hypothetical protein
MRAQAMNYSICYKLLLKARENMLKNDHYTAIKQIDIVINALKTTSERVKNEQS